MFRFSNYTYGRNRIQYCAWRDICQLNFAVCLVTVIELCIVEMLTYVDALTEANLLTN